MRVTTSKTTRARHKKVLKRAKGFKGARSVRFNVANETLLHAMRYEYIHRRTKKREIKKLWITRINAFVRAEGMTYSRFIEGIKKAGAHLDRKVLAWLCMNDTPAMSAYVTLAKQALGQS